MKRILRFTIVLAVVVSLGVFITRWQVESPNRTVEIVYDLPGLKELSLKTGISLENLLQDLEEVGVQTIAIQPLTLGELFLANQALEPEILGLLPTENMALAKLVPLPVVFQGEDFLVVQDAGLQVAPKLSTVPWEVEPLWVASDPSLVILSGQAEFPLERLEGFTGRLALVEFSTPGIAQLNNSELVRLHGISAREMVVLSEERIVNRYLRAARERNIRVLYVRPFVEGEYCWERSLALLDQLQKRLVADGFTIGVAQPFASWRPSTLWLAVIGAGIWAGTIGYGQGLFPSLKRLFAVGGILGWLGTVGLLFVAPTLAKPGLALLAAIVFPCLAIQRGKSYWQVAGVSLVGALFVVASLAGTEYLLKVQEFRGVKVAHLVPIALVAFAVVRPLRAWLNKDVPVRYLLWGGCVGLVGMIYILRTGNFGVPVPQWEINAREVLENLLGARPRTKEFLIGHPALYLALRDREPEKSWWLPVAVVGQISLVNTFTHTHTPLQVSLLRTLYGLVFGYFLGWLVAKLVVVGKRWNHRRRQGVALR